MNMNESSVNWYADDECNPRPHNSIWQPEQEHVVRISEVFARKERNSTTTATETSPRNSGPVASAPGSKDEEGVAIVFGNLVEAAREQLAIEDAEQCNAARSVKEVRKALERFYGVDFQRDHPPLDWSLDTKEAAVLFTRSPGDQRTYCNLAVVGMVGKVKHRIAAKAHRLEPVAAGDDFGGPTPTSLSVQGAAKEELVISIKTGPGYESLSKLE